MAGRSVRSKIPRSVRPRVPRHIRRLNSAVSAVSADRPERVDRKPDGVQKKPKDSNIPSSANAPTNPDINLADFKQLFSSLSTPKLTKSALTLHMSAVGPAVDLGLWVMNSRLMENPRFRRTALGFTERTFYDHFCAGKDLEAAGETVQNLWHAGISAMLDYGLEHADDNESCDRNLEEFIRTIEWTRSLPDYRVSFVVVKITAICPTNLLKRVSDLLRWQYKNKYLHLPWKLRTFPIFSESSPLHHTPKRPPPLSPEEEHDLQLAYERLDKICESSFVSNTPLLIDAEDTAVQPAIDYFAYSAAIRHDSGDGEPLIFNTIQAYLKDAKERLVRAKRAADRMGAPVGFKLVRGAYMSRENQLASSLEAKSPIHNSINETHDCYNSCAEFLLHEMAKGAGSVVLATHNIESGKLAASKASELGIKRDSPRLHFAQLYGMAEALSFGLRNAGFRVSKYLPFGPVEQIMPYLLRRAEENRGLLSASSLDRLLMRKELMRRLTSRDSCNLQYGSA